MRADEDQHERDGAHGGYEGADGQAADAGDASQEIGEGLLQKDGSIPKKEEEDKADGRDDGWLANPQVNEVLRKPRANGPSAGP
jgi:hypothetical protein